MASKASTAAQRGMCPAAACSPTSRTVRFPMPRGHGALAAVARRTDLDSAFLDVARAAGAKVHDGHSFLEARLDDGGIVLGVDGIGPVRAPYAIGADGMWSPL